MSNDQPRRSINQLSLKPGTETDMPVKNKCLISFFNTRSGRFKWWDQFPILLKQSLAALDVDCHYFYKSQLPQSLFQNGEILINPERIGDGSLGDEKWLLENVWPIMEKYQQVIIHTHSYHPPFKFRKLIRNHGRTKWAATIHRCPVSSASPLTRFYKVLLRRNHYLPDWYIGVSNATSEYIKHSFGESKVKTIHNGIDLSGSKVRKDWPEQDQSSNRRFLFINRLDNGKGVELLVEAVPRILQRSRNFYLTIVGDGPLRTSVEQLVADCDSPNISFEGHSSDVEHFYSTHDVLLMPYTKPQGLSLISIEARSHGLPAIYTGLGGVSETRDSSNGIEMKEATAEALLTAIEDMEQTPSFGQLIKGCYEGLEYFSIERMTREYSDFYLSLFR